MRADKSLSIVVLCAVALACAACGSSGGSSPAPAPTAPAVSAITITGGNAVHSDVSLDADPIVTNVSTATSSMAVTFTSTETVTVPEDSVTLTCASGTTPTLGTPTASDTTFTFAITGTFPQLTTCTLAFSTAITNGTPMVAVAKNFMTGCSTSDNFSVNTVTGDPACWTLQSSAAGTITLSDNALTLATTSFVDGGQGPAAMKIFASTSTTITQMVKLTSTNMSETQDACTFALFDLTGNGVMMGTEFDSGLGQVVITAQGQIDGQSTRSDPVPLTVDGDNAVTEYLRLSYSANGISTSYSATGSDFIPITCSALPCAFDLTPTGDLYSFLESEHGVTAHTVSCKFETYTVTGASATGQD